MWFMKELPYPDIDLNSIKGSSANVFPREFAHKVMPDPASGNYYKGEFHKLYVERLEKNFSTDKMQQDEKDRRINSAKRYEMKDFAQASHILP